MKPPYFVEEIDWSKPVKEIVIQKGTSVGPTTCLLQIFMGPVIPFKLKRDEKVTFLDMFKEDAFRQPYPRCGKV